jgi:hypothetical protein
VNERFESVALFADCGDCDCPLVLEPIVLELVEPLVPAVPAVDDPAAEPVRLVSPAPLTIAFVSVNVPVMELGVVELPVVPDVPVVPDEPPPDVRQPVTTTVSLLPVSRFVLLWPLTSCGDVDCAAAVHTASANAATVPNTCERFIYIPPLLVV